jgi:hypothetical protein
MREIEKALGVANEVVKAYYYYDGPPASSRAARHCRYEDGAVIHEYRGGCGTYRFWNGERCVDARWRWSEKGHPKRNTAAGTMRLA